MIRAPLVFPPMLMALFVCVASCGGEKYQASNSQRDRSPNVVIILADDLGYGDLSSFGSKRIRTPSIDRLADEGVKLTDFYASGNVCTPSRAGLLTGRYSIRMGLADKTISTTDPRGMPNAEATLAEIFSDNGYSTALIGKWHLGHESASLRPLNHGFDKFFGLLHSNDEEEEPFYRADEPVQIPIVQEALTELFTKEALAFIDDAGDRPFFLLFSLTAPHKPIRPSADYATKSGVGPYGDVVLEIDDSVGQLMAALKEAKIDDNTIVIFTSDNGPFPEGSSGGLRGGKGTSWDGAYRVPFVMRWPDGLPAGKSRSGISMNIDLLPTLARMTGITLPDDLVLDGKNIWTMLGDGGDSPHEVLYFFHNERIAALRSDNWRLVLSDYPPWRDAKPFSYEKSADLYPLLFNMVTDPAERYNQSRDHPDALQKMTDFLEAGRLSLESLSTISDAESYVNGEKS